MVTARCWHSSHKGESRYSATAQVKRISPDSVPQNSIFEASSTSTANKDFMGDKKSRVLILGGGFAGLYARWSLSAGNISTSQ